MAIKSHLTRLSLLLVLLISTLFLPVLDVNAQCPGLTVYTYPIPRGTPTIHIDWVTATSFAAPSVTDTFLDLNGETLFVQRRYTWQMSVPWSLQLTDANGTPLFAKSGTATGHECPCGSFADGDVGSEDIDVSSLTKSGDLVVTQSSQACLGFSYEVWNIGVKPPVFLFASAPAVESLPVGLFVSFDSTAPPTFLFDLDPAQITASPNPWNTPAMARVLTHKYGSDDSYPSAYQIDRGDDHARPRFRFPGIATANGSGTAANMWFRVVDPPDTAPYVVQANDAHPDDNRDTFSGGKGILMTPGCTDFSAQSTCAAQNGTALAVSSGADGRAEVVLETTDRYAGDNYQILASFAAPGDDGKFPCEAQDTCTKSAPITAWKRIYEEQRSMFRRGSFLSQDAVIGDTDVFVKDIRMFRQGDNAVFMHSAGRGSKPVTESHVINIVARQAGVAAHLHLADGSLANTFVPNRISTVEYLGDAVGVSNAGGSPDDVFKAGLGALNVAGTRPVEELFNTMFVDATFVSGDSPFVPLADNIEASPARGNVASDASLFADHWFQNLPNVARNYRMLIGAAREYDGALGVTVDRSDLHASYSFRGQIERGVRDSVSEIANLDPEVVSFENVAHELVHQWRVNLNPTPPGGDSVGHCVESAFDNPRAFCRMHLIMSDARHNAEHGDGIITLHYVKRGPAAVVDSEYVSIRNAVEPMP